MIEALIKALIEVIFGRLDTATESREPDPEEVRRRREEVRKFLEARRQAQGQGAEPPPLPGNDSDGAPLPPPVPLGRVQPPPVPAAEEPVRRPTRPIPEPKPSTRPVPEPKPSTRPAPAAPTDWAARQQSIQRQLQSAEPSTEEATRLLHKQLGEARRKASNARQDVADAAGKPRNVKRLALGTPADIRRAMLLREVLGPCRALEPHGQAR